MNHWLEFGKKIFSLEVLTTKLSGQTVVTIIVQHNCTARNEKHLSVNLAAA